MIRGQLAGSMKCLDKEMRLAVDGMMLEQGLELGDIWFYTGWVVEAKVLTAWGDKVIGQAIEEDREVKVKIHPTMVRNGTIMKGQHPRGDRGITKGRSGQCKVNAVLAMEVGGWGGSSVPTFIQLGQSSTFGLQSLDLIVPQVEGIV